MNKINIMLSVTAASVIMATSIGYAAEKGVVTTNDLNIRSGPGVSYTVLTKVNKGTAVTITEKKDGWYKVILSNGQEGWASASYIDVVKETSSQEGEIINESVYLRETASWSAKKGEILKVGTKVKILSNEGSWVKVQYNNSVGYIGSDYIRIAEIPNGNINSGGSTNSSSQEGEIINESVYLRETASWSAKKGEILKVGTKVKILSNEGSWVKVEYNNNVGYVGSDYIKVMISQDTGSSNLYNGEIINESVYLRETASWSAKKGEILKVGTKVKILSNEGSWVKVEYNNNVGYVGNSYVKIIAVEEDLDRKKKIEAVVSFAKEQIGKPYVYGDKGPNSFDCSGLLYYVFDKAAGIQLPRISRDQAKVGIEVSLSNIEAGDIIAFDFNKDGTVTHVGMYVGDGQFIHALKPGTTVQLTSISQTYWKNAIATIRRVI